MQQSAACLFKIKSVNAHPVTFLLDTLSQIINVYLQCRYLLYLYKQMGKTKLAFRVERLAKSLKKKKK